MTKFGPGSYYDYLGFTIAEDAIYNRTQYQDKSGQDYDDAGQDHDELGKQQYVLDEIREDIARKKAIQEYQAWIEEFIYKFSKAVTDISSGSKDPVNDYNVIKSFLDIINKNSLNTASIRGLENKYVFEQTFLSAQNLFSKLAETSEVQNHLLHLRKLEEARLEQERKLEEQRLERQRKKREAEIERERKLKEARLERQQREAEEERVRRKVLVEAAARNEARFIKAVKILAVVSLILILVVTIYSWGPQIYGTTYLAVLHQYAEMGHSDTQTKLGLMYHEGDGVAKDYNEAVGWLKKAATKGNVEAQHKLVYRFIITLSCQTSTSSSLYFQRKITGYSLISCMYL
jgi:hypothetical protein